MKGRLSASGSVQAWLPRSGSPYDMQPRQRRETSRPVLPNLTMSMLLPSVQTLAAPEVCRKPSEGREPP